MAITGGVKFFSKSKFLYTDGARAYSARGDSAQEILNHSRLNGYVSTGSDDTITEIFIIELDEIKRIDSLLLNSHNFKDIKISFLSNQALLKEDGFNLLKEDGFRILTEGELGFVDSDLHRYLNKEDDFQLLLEQDGGKIKLEQFNFDTVEPVLLLKEDGALITKEDGFGIKLEGSTPGFEIDTDTGLQLRIVETEIDTSTSYYSFDSTQCIKIIIEVKQTQIANQQKSLKALIGADEVGTLEGYPKINNVFDRNVRKFRMLGNKSRVIKGPESFSSNFNFATYPGQSDIDLVEELQDEDDDFLIWLCGGREGSDYFRFDTRGFEIDDLYLVKLSSTLPLNYTNNIYVSGYNTKIQFSETVG